MATYLLKTEPDDYSFEDLRKDKKTTWDGVENNTALKHMRSVVKGDEAFIYHSGDEKRIVGLAEIVSDPYPDRSQDDPRVVVFDIKAKKPAATPVSLEQIKAENRFSDFALVRQPRLSVMPVPGPIEAMLRGMAGL